jgi:CRISPR-associated protein Cas1
MTRRRFTFVLVNIPQINSAFISQCLNRITHRYNTQLNQTISFLHEPSDARFSLSLDLSEVFKPIIVFKTIFDLVNNKRIKIEKHFNKEVNYASLNEEGLKIFIAALDERLNSSFQHPILKRKITYKQAIKIDGYKLIKMIIEEKEFVPYNEYEKK